MKILYVITGLGQGGAERVVCDLADSMVSKGHNVKIAYLTGNILTYPKSKDIDLIKINLNKAKDLPISYLHLAKLIKSYNPDIVHSHMVHANILTRLIRISTPINKLISTAHSNNEGGSLRMLMYRATHSLSNFSTNVSKNAVEAFEIKRAIPKNGMKAIYNGIDLEKYQFITEAKNEIIKEFKLDIDCKLILAVGRFNEQKDYLNLIKAIELLKKKFSLPVKLLIAGDGEKRESIEKFIKELKLDNDIILLGRRNDIPELMSAADIFVLSSKSEGFGLVVAEAMACQCLVVATDCGGVSEVLNGNGFLVQKENPTLLSEGLYKALNLNIDYRCDLVNSAKRHIYENFNLKDIANEWNIVYESIIVE